MKRLFALCLICISVNNAIAQHFRNDIMDRVFTAQVKSIDEFVQRFNGKENNPEIANSENRTNQLLGLFDFQMNHADMPDSLFKQHILSFIDNVVKNETMLKITDADVYAETDVTISIQGKEGKLKIIFQNQTYKEDRKRWAIVGVKGLADTGLLDLTHFYGISPVDHETYFMSLSDVFQYNNAEIIGYRGRNTKIDELSVFLAFAMDGKVRIKMVDNLTFHFCNTPQYVFTVNEYGRYDTNSGWLISNLKKMDDKHKYQYITNLLGL